MCKHYIRKAPYAIYVSQYFLQSRYPCDGVFIGCSDVNIEFPGNEILKARFNKINHGFKQHKVRLGIIGALDVEFKGHKTAIYALRLLKNRIPEFTLSCLGPGDISQWEKNCKKIGIEDNVEFCGTLPGGRQVLEWLDSIDIFLIASFT